MDCNPKPQIMPNSTYVTKVSTNNTSVSQNVNPVIRRIPAVSIIAQANNVAFQKGTHSIVTPKPQIILNPTYVTKEHHLNSRTPLSVITNSNLSNVSLNNNNGTFRKSIPSILVKPKPQIIPNPSYVPIKTSLNRAPCPNVSSAAIRPALSNRNFPSSSTCTPKSNISMIANKNGIFHFATPGKLPTSMTYDIPAEHCFEEEIVDDTTVHHSGSLFVASTKKQQLPQQTDTDLLRARDSFAVCDFSNGNTSNNVSTSVEADVQDSDSSVSSITIKRKRPINLKLKEKSDSSLKDLDDSDSSLSDDFEKPSNSKVNKKISEKPSSFKVNTKKSSEILINDEQSISISCSHNDSNEEDILEILPDNYDYKILSCEVSHNEFHHIKALIRININDESEAVKWKHDFEASSKTDFRVKKTWGKLDGEGRVLYKKKFRCHHNTLAEKSGSKKPHEKHIQCPATMVITVKNKKMQWSRDNLLKSHPGEILLNGTHNHSVLGGDILRFRRPTPELKEKFTQMFTQYPPHTPSTARDAYLSDIDVDNEFALLDCVKDGAQVPSMSWLYRLYHKVYKENCGDPSGDGMISALEKYIQNYNEKCGELCAKMGTTEDGLHHFVVVCTPLMKRVHTHLKSSGETMFMDSSGSMDGTNARIFMLITPSVVCGLPLGILMTFSEAEDVVSAALELWKTLLPEKAFFGRGMKGPKIIMTDDCPSERNSLENSFPFAFLLLCVFHVLNAMWRYIWDSKHGVKSNHRQEIYFAFYSILYAASVDEFDELFDKALQNEAISGYELVVNHLKDLKARAKEWAVCFRSEMLNRGHHTNNYAEASMKIIKDKILCRIKAFNPVQLLDHLLTRLESYYKRKIAFIINNRAEGAQRSRYSIPEEKLKPLVAEKVSSSTLYLVKNIQKNTQYLVDMDLELCACPVGNCGAPCKHQAAIAKQFGVSSHQLLPYTDVTLKTILFYIMTGHTNVPPGLFDTLRGGISKPVDLSTIPEFSEHVALDTAVTTSQCSKDGATTSGTAEDNIVVESSEIKLRPFFDDLVKRCDASPDVFKVPLEKFLKSYWSIVERGNYESTLSSALATFSKDQSVQTPLRRGRISNQPTAPARLTVHKGDSRTAQKGGRPRNAAVMKKPPEHGYSQAMKRKQAPRVDSWACLPKKQAKVPHSLSQCVTANVRLPK